VSEREREMKEAPEPAGCGRKLLLVAGGEGRMESSPPVVGRGIFWFI
jgi:hypothetical protein